MLRQTNRAGVVLRTIFAAAAAMAAAFAGPALADPIIGVDIESGNGSPTNWTPYTLPDVGIVKTNLVAEDGSITSAGFVLNGVDTAQNFNVPASVVPSHPNSLQLVGADILFGGAPAAAQFSGLAPSATYNYWVFVSSSAVDTITVTGSTVDNFVSPAVLHTSQRINGVLGSSAFTFASYARQIVSSPTGTIDITIASTGSPTPSGFAVQLVPEPATVGLLALGGLALARRRR